MIPCARTRVVTENEGALYCNKSTMAAKGSDKGWAKFKAEMKNRRTRKGKEKANAGSGSPEEIIVQRLSSSVSGKAQKYSRVGPREFVAFPYDELTIGNIKLACHKHFAPVIDASMVCDVLAGDQGPSCRSLEQLPNQKVFHIRFVEGRHAEIDDDEDESSDSKKKRIDSPFKSVPTTSVLITEAKAKVYPKSLSISSMLKLGKTLEATSTLVEIASFDLEALSWPKCYELCDFSIDKKPFSSGGFREAYKASSKSPRFKGKQWVIKKYLPETMEVIEEMNETVETHTRKVVQMHHLARSMAANLRSAVERLGKEMEFGEMFRYNEIYLGKMGEEFMTVEEFVPGSFVKYLNNTGDRCEEADDDCIDKAECLAHFSYTKSDKNLMVLDIQGSGHELYDPEIASADLTEDGKVLFCAGNLSSTAITAFVTAHKCNKFCELLGLPTL